MLPNEINELLTRVGPGTPGGEMIRRYWQPVALEEELPSGGAPVPVRLLGEDLALFRDEEGRPALVGLRCPHRGADLSYGRLEDGGIRCIYHGWLFDSQGRCLEQPGEPPGSAFHEKIRQPAYPCLERSGVIFAYLGPGDPPLLPGYDFLTAPAGHVVAAKMLYECNYLQGNEGNIDSVHLSFVHRVMSNIGPGYSEHCWFDTIETEETEYGVRNYFIRHIAPGNNYVHITTFLMPNAGAFGGGRGNGYSVNWHVPVDDEHHWRYTFIYRADQLLEKEAVRGARTPVTADYKPIPNKSNRYLQDRSLMRDVVYSGIATQYFQAQDTCVIETVPIQNRTLEHLGHSDGAIVAERTMILRAIKDVQEGLDPPGVVRDPAANRLPLTVRGDTLSASVDWRTYWKNGALA